MEKDVRFASLHKDVYIAVSFREVDELNYIWMIDFQTNLHLGFYPFYNVLFEI